jgi:pimeloyl-[acyl-carrier protein] methyl ester esterase
VSLHIETVGSGPDVMLIHGWGMHGGVWSDVRDQLAQDYRVHVVDLPGMGYSQPIAGFDLERLANVLAMELPESATLVGWSLGGQMAMQVALDHPGKVNRLVLVGSTPRFVQGDDWQAGIAPEVFRQFAAQVAADYHDTMTRFLGLQAFGGEASRTLLRELKERFFARPAPDAGTLREALAILLETDLRTELPRLRLPVLLVHGNRDTLAPAAASRWMAQQFPQAQLHVIEGASHAPFLSHPETFMHTVRTFLKETNPAENVA